MISEEPILLLNGLLVHYPSSEIPTCLKQILSVQKTDGQVSRYSCMRTGRMSSLWEVAGCTSSLSEEYTITFIGAYVNMCLNIHTYIYYSSI